MRNSCYPTTTLPLSRPQLHEERSVIQPELVWDIGPAYDFFVSLHVLHHPEAWDLRRAWAAGVRSRLPAEQRDFLQRAAGALHLPSRWVYHLPPPKDSLTLLAALSQIASADRLPVLTGYELDAPVMCDLTQRLHAIRDRGWWDEEDKATAQRTLHPLKLTQAELTNLLDWWAQAEAFGEQILPALQSYYEVFFAEEEARITPILRQALAQGQALATRLTLPELLEELSQGVTYDQSPAVDRLILAPSFWATPLLVYDALSEREHVMLFGARPATMSLVPGEVIPEHLYRVLKTLADPTRLRILRYLSQEPHTPAQLAHKLRLRTPTVLHHLQALRLAQLVRLFVSTQEEGKRRYAIRPDAIRAAFETLDAFLHNQ